MVTVKRRASAEVLSQFPDLAQLSQEQLRQLADSSVIEELPAGRLLFKPGLREDESLYLLAGEVALVSDNRAVGDVAAGTEAARTALAPERPRTLWGWSKSRVQVAWVDGRRLGPRAAPATPAPTPNDAALSAPQVELRQALQRAEAERDSAQTEVQRLQREAARLTGELTHTREQLQRLQQALATADLAAPHTPPGAAPQTAVDPRPEAAEAEKTGGPLPSLRIDPSERTTLAPAEIEAVLGPTPMAIPTDQRCRRHH